MPSGTSGACERCSTAMKATWSAAEAIRIPIVWAEPQPTRFAWVRAKTSSESALVMRTAPSASKWRVAAPARLSLMIERVVASTKAPTGTLTKKIHSQPSALVRIPPSRTPTAAPLPPIAPQIPSALLRSEPSSNVVVMIESAAGERMAAPRPCTARAAISMPSEPERPQARDARVKRATPDMKTTRRPSTSATRPPRSRKPPKVSA